jgi:hypothetical protein
MTDTREPDETSKISRMRWRLGLPSFVIPLHVGWGPEMVSAHLPLFDKNVPIGAVSWKLQCGVAMQVLPFVLLDYTLRCTPNNLANSLGSGLVGFICSL